jgi:predicted phage gp36 major capsid-like protein
VSKAEADRQKISDSIRTLEADRSDVRAEYREMLSNFMADAQKKLAEIDGDARRANVTAQARAEANAAAYAPAASTSAPAAAGQAAVVSPFSTAAPSVSGYIDKDFSGYGAADSDFAFDDID